MKSIVRMRLGLVLALAIIVGTILIPCSGACDRPGAGSGCGDPNVRTDHCAADGGSDDGSDDGSDRVADNAAATKPVQIPEPLTVVLFGTGLAALSAAVAARRKQ